jgi:hypothetical protein
MKSVILLILAVSVLETAAKPVRAAVQRPSRANVESIMRAVGPDGVGPGGAICVGKRETVGNNDSTQTDRSIGPGGKVADPPGAAPKKVQLKSEMEEIAGAGKVQKIKMRYIIARELARVLILKVLQIWSLLCAQHDEEKHHERRRSPMELWRC